MLDQNAAQKQVREKTADVQEKETAARRTRRRRQSGLRETAESVHSHPEDHENNERRPSGAVFVDGTQQEHERRVGSVQRQSERQRCTGLTR